MFTIVRDIRYAPTSQYTRPACPWCGRTCRCNGGTNFATDGQIIWFRTQDKAPWKEGKAQRGPVYRTFPEHDLSEVQLSPPPRYQMASVLRAAPRPWTQAIRAFRGIRRTRDVVRE